jgi:hypothetical protein
MCGRLGGRVLGPSHDLGGLGFLPRLAQVGFFVGYGSRTSRAQPVAGPSASQRRPQFLRL